MRNVEVAFSVESGGQQFQCGQTYEGLGREDASISFSDMRFFVHDIGLVDPNGQVTDLILDDDGIWQRDGVALLDFEDGCSNGTNEVNTSVRGRIAPGAYSGVRFRIGVPNQLNSPQTVLENRGSPLNQASMFWAWRSGYKFIRIDTDSTSFRFHLGSVGCDEDFACRFENIPTVALAEFNWETQSVNLDLSALFERTNVTRNTDGTAPGCMGDPDDPECTGIFERLGLDQDSDVSAFSVRDK